jgi:hypothetical protein
MRKNKLCIAIMIYFLLLILLADASNCDDFIVNINIGIDADFTFQPDNPKVREKVVFTDTSDPNITVNWTWDFGDGKISYLQNPSHRYSNIGAFQISLTVLTEGGINDTELKNITILKRDSTKSKNIPPTALSNGPYYSVTNKQISFDGSLSFDSDGNIVSYIWDFGDGRVKYGEFVSHSYEGEGNYTVKLTVEDNDGSTDVDYTFSHILNDTDNDGWDDYIEEIYGTNPNDNEDYPLDTDNDGIPDESIDGIIIGDNDDDNDGLPDEIELSIGLNPKDANDVEEIISDGITYFLIDIDGDNIWDYIYNPITEELNPYLIEEKTENPYVFLVIVGVTFFVIVIILFKTGTLSSKLLFIDKYKEKLYYFSREKIGKYKSEQDKKSIFDRFFKKK